MLARYWASCDGRGSFDTRILFPSPDSSRLNRNPSKDWSHVSGLTTRIRRGAAYIQNGVGQSPFPSPSPRFIQTNLIHGLLSARCGAPGGHKEQGPTVNLVSCRRGAPECYCGQGASVRQLGELSLRCSGRSLRAGAKASSVSCRCGAPEGHGWQGPGQAIMG